MELDLELYRRDILVPESPPVRLSVVDIAPEEPNQTICFIHGFGGQATQWKYQLANFSNENRVIAIDLRGHGDSQGPATRYTMEETLSDINYSLEQAGIDQPAILVGHSFGGAIAAEYSLAHPDRVAKLILIATPIEYQLNWLFRTALRLPSPILRVTEPFTQSWLGAPPTILKRLYNACMRGWDGRSRFSAITHPTLVIRGDRDRVFERPDFEEVGQVIPAAEELNVGASGHMVMLERRKAVDRAIERFIGPSHLSWRSEGDPPSGKQPEHLLDERPWLAQYESGVPSTIAVPPVPTHHLLQSAARRFPRKPALIFEGRKISYRKLLDLSRRVASGLSQRGIKPGDRVVLLLPNIPEFVISYFAVLSLGAVPVFSLPLTEEDELIRQIRAVGAKAIITLDSFSQLAAEACSQTDLEWVILTDGGEYLPFLKRFIYRRNRNSPPEKPGPQASISGEMLQFGELLRDSSARPQDIKIEPEALAVIIFTGGTTAAPKGVMLSHRNLVANAVQARHWMPDAQEGGERFLCVVPFTHSYGMTAALNVPISVGAGLILKAQFDVQDILQTIRATQPTIFPGVPSMYVAIKDFPGVRKYNIESIKACLSGAAPLPLEVQESFEKLTRGRLVEAYGLTEASPATHANPLSGNRKAGTIGIPLPSTEAKVVDMRKGRKTMPIGQIGELAVHGPQIMLGYWENPKATSQTITRDGWLLTGDIVQMDPEGYFRVIARKADMWYPGSPTNPAFPRDVEEVIYEIPQVKEAAVIAVANQPIAFVIAQTPAPSAASITAYCERRLPPELVPRLVIFLEEFPRSFIGKVLRRELRARYESQNAESK